MARSVALVLLDHSFALSHALGAPALAWWPLMQTDEVVGSIPARGASLRF
jgi:hypothetical protein